MKTFKQITHFILQFILWLISWCLTPIIEFATLVVVIFKYKFGAVNYFDGKGLEADYRSARDNRSLWNFLLVGKNGEKFTRKMNNTISQMIGRNSYIRGGLTWFGWFMYYFLYIIDVSAWLDWELLFSRGVLKLKKGHCRESLN